jgi:aminoglycoside phosphotransferase (APT) family kinase protein
VHGDYGPNNMLFDPETFEVAAVLDWEWARVGDPIEDLAWCEWIVRMHHPGVVGALGRLFEGYGRRPAWEARQRARVERCRELLRVVAGDETAVALWRERLEVTAGWRE